MIAIFISFNESGYEKEIFNNQKMTRKNLFLIAIVKRALALAVCFVLNGRMFVFETNN